MLIAISGGIGAGKSIVARIVDKLGFRVYDTDTKAKTMMHTDASIRERLRQEFGDEIVGEQGVDRALLSSIVFNDQKKLKLLNSIVHNAVLQDVENWHNAANGVSFVETALLYQSGMDKVVDRVWMVEAPKELRIERVMKRNGLSREEVMSRIRSQHFVAEEVHQNEKIIINDDKTPLLPQIFGLLKRL